MVTLLNHLRLLHPAGFDLFAASEYVQLGLTTRDDAFRHMAARVLHAYAAVNRWPAHVVASVTPDAVMELTSPTGLQRGVVSRRLALVAYLSWLIRDGREPDVTAILTVSWKVLAAKLVDECTMDAVVALRTIGAEDRQHLRCLALRLPSTVNYDDDGMLRKTGMFMHLLCDRRYTRPELFDSGARLDAPLLPPYGVIIERYIGTHGELLVAGVDRGKVYLSSELLQLLKFFVETPSPGFTPRESAAISAAVTESLAVNGVGVPEGGRVRPISSATDVERTPAISQLLQLACNSGERERLTRAVQKSPSSADSDTTIGLRIVRWMRNVAAHWLAEGHNLALVGLYPSIIHAALHAGVTALTAGGGYAMGAQGVPVRCGNRAA